MMFEVPVLTFTLETLTHETPQHLAAVIAERRGFVGVHIQSMRTDLEVFNGGKSCRTNTRKFTVTKKINNQEVKDLDRQENHRLFFFFSCPLQPQIPAFG